MELVVLANNFLFFFSLIMVLIIFVLPPLLLLLTYWIKGKQKHIKFSSELPSVSVIIVVHNAERLISDKIKNTLSLNYPSDRIEVIIFIDGSTDRTETVAREFEASNVHVLSSMTHEGKINGMNSSIKKSSGEILAFTDVDAVLAPDSLLKLVRYFGDSLVGGVCGKKVLIKGNNKLEKAQDVYTNISGWLKFLENQIGSISTNDGTLYMIRKKLYKDIPPAVTDDLYVGLSIISQNYRFLYEPEAKAFMRAPSKNPRHELKRRRRIVSQSLRGIFLLKEVLNPLRYGVLSISLFINKVLRRSLPILLLMLFPSSIALSSHYATAQVALIMQIVFYSIALIYGILLQHMPEIKLVTRIASLAFYFCLGNYGTLLGLVDFFTGKKITKW